MPITRSSEVSSEAGQLFSLFGHCVEGYQITHVADAAGNIWVGALHAHAKIHNLSREEYIELVEESLALLKKNAEENWKREPQPTDIPVGEN